MGNEKKSVRVIERIDADREKDRETERQKD